MNNPTPDIHPELEVLFDRYRRSPDSHVFAPLADSCRKQGMLEEAIEIVDRGVSLHPDYASGHVVRGKCYFDRGDLDEAEGAFDTVLRMDPNNLVALRYLGNIHAGRGDASAAREHFKHILALDPDNREIRTRLGEIEDAAADEPPVDEDWPRAGSGSVLDGSDDKFEGAPITLGDEDAVAADDLATMTLADIYRSQGYTEKALRIYRDVLRRQPDNAEVISRIRSMEGEGAVVAGTGATSSRAEKAGDLVFEDVRPDAAPGIRSDAGSPPAAKSTGEDIPAAPVAPGNENTPGADKAPDRPPARAGTDGLDGRPMEEERSYDQFKRWLKNLAD